MCEPQLVMCMLFRPAHYWSHRFLPESVKHALLAIAERNFRLNGQTHTDVFEITAWNRDQITDITVSSGKQIYCSSISSPVARKLFQLSIQSSLDPCLYLSLDLLSVSVKLVHCHKGVVAFVRSWFLVKILCADHGKRWVVVDTWRYASAPEAVRPATSAYSSI